MQESAMLSNLRGKRVLVMGLGRFGGGAGACRYLIEQGAVVTATDKASPETLTDSVAALAGLPIAFHLGEHREEDFRQADIVVVNPAVKRDSLWLALASQHGAVLTSEMNLFWQRCPARIIGVTGSNGKSTTAAMIHALAQAGVSAGQLPGRAWLGGNIGQDSLLCRAHEIAPEDTVTVELSSFQLTDLAHLHRSPHIAVVTNIAPNHLDWHGTMADYVAAKQNILRFQQADDYAILNHLDEPLHDWAALTAGQVAWYPRGNEAPLKLRIPGAHNQINAAAALAVARILGVTAEIAHSALAAFPGLPHRLELVAEINAVRYYNDSIATTPESAIVAVEAFAEPKVIILGGYDKKVSFSALAHRLLDPAAQVRAAILIGQVATNLQTTLAAAQADWPGRSSLHVRTAETFAQAVTLAHDLAEPGDVVLLSPACASYDMFRNFQQRGERFRDLVATLGHSARK